jgi:hypothetical protein
MILLFTYLKYLKNKKYVTTKLESILSKLMKIFFKNEIV